MDLVGVTQITVPRTRGDVVLSAGVRPLGGGSWLFSEQQPEVTGLVDLMALGWEPVVETPDTLTIAATCLIRELTEIPLRPEWPAQELVRLCADSLLMSFKIWNMATVGGNVCTALPAGAMTSLLAGLDAVAVIWDAEGGERRAAVAEFVTGVRTTAMGPEEFLRSIEIPVKSLKARVAFRRIALSNLGRSGTLVIGRQDADGAVVVTVTASTPAPVQLRFDGVPTAAELAHALDGIDVWYDDPHGAPDWREAVSRLYAEQIRVELSTGGAA